MFDSVDDDDDELDCNVLKRNRYINVTIEFHGKSSVKIKNCLY